MATFNYWVCLTIKLRDLKYMYADEKILALPVELVPDFQTSSSPSFAISGKNHYMKVLTTV